MNKASSYSNGKIKTTQGVVEMEKGAGFVRLMKEAQGMGLKQFEEWLKHLTLDELDHIVFATEYIAKQAVKEMGERQKKK